jgi:hypothetical protein
MIDMVNLKITEFFFTRPEIDRGELLKRKFCTLEMVHRGDYVEYYPKQNKSSSWSNSAHSWHQQWFRGEAC